MSSLYIIRHGQASFGAPDYDVLSSLGEEQSHTLGRHFARLDVTFDAIYVGPCRRHRDTYLHMCHGAREEGHELPAAEERPELDEYPAFRLYDHCSGDIRARFPQLSGGTPIEPRLLRRALEHVAQRWVRGAIAPEGVETYAQFSQRIDAVLSHIRSAQGRSRRIAVVTSGGPLAVATGLALGLSPDRTLRLTSVIANASFTEIRYRDDEVSLYSFNNTSHLSSAKLLTML